MIIPFLLFMYIFVLPGTLLYHTISGQNSLLIKLCIGTSIGIALIPLLSFAAAMLFKTYISFTLLLSLATIINITQLIHLYRLRQS